MSELVAVEDLVLLVLVSLVPALGYLAWVRKGERYRTEGWGPLLGAFLYGAIFATLAAGMIEILILSVGSSIAQRFPGPEFIFLRSGSPASTFFLVLVVAPFVEEALKASGVAGRRSFLRQVADGPVLGASVGLGFGFFETFLYGLGAFLAGGLAAGLALIVIRSLSSVLLHGSTTGMFGYGYARGRFGVPGPAAGSYYLLAVGMHSSFNALASLAAILALLGFPVLAVEAASLLALLVAVAYAFGAIEHVRSVIASSDYPSLLKGAPAYRPGNPPPRKR